MDFDAYVGRLTAEQTAQLLQTVLGTMGDDAIMDVLTGTLPSDVKDELAARWS